MKWKYDTYIYISTVILSAGKYSSQYVANNRCLVIVDVSTSLYINFNWFDHFGSLPFDWNSLFMDTILGDSLALGNTPLKISQENFNKLRIPSFLLRTYVWWEGRSFQKRPSWQNRSANQSKAVAMFISSKNRYVLKNDHVNLRHSNSV